MSRLSDDEVLNLRLAAATLYPGGNHDDLGQEAAPKGLRLLHRVSRLMPDTARAVADHFGGLAKLQRATVDDLTGVEGVDEKTAHAIRDTLTRVTETTILDQYS